MTDISAPFGASAQGDGRLDAPTFHRNSPAILQAAEKLMRRRTGDAVEVGSGSGQHACAFAAQFPDITWWPTDPLPAHRASIDAWRLQTKCSNVMPAAHLDIEDRPWQIQEAGGPAAGSLTAILAINVLHITAWSVSCALFDAAARYLAQDGVLMIYGPFAEDGRHNAESNQAFDRTLRAQNPDWGIRDLTVIRTTLATQALRLSDIIAVPANNRVLSICRAG